MNERPIGTRSAEALLRATVSPATVVLTLVQEFELSSTDAEAAVAAARAAIDHPVGSSPTTRR